MTPPGETEAGSAGMQLRWAPYLSKRYAVAPHRARS